MYFARLPSAALPSKNVQVTVRADWAGDPVRAQHVSFDVVVEADSSESEILELIRYTDQVAEIPNSLRMGTDVKISGIKAIASR